MNRYIALSGLCTRRKADELIKKGYIAVNGKVVRELGVKVPLDAVVTYKGMVIYPEKPFAYKIYKPRGVAGSILSPGTRKKHIGDLLPVEPTPNTISIFPLDRNMEGLSIVTNNGILIEKIMRNKHRIPQVFHVTVNKPLDASLIEKLKKGYISSKIYFVPDDVILLENKGNRRLLSIVVSYRSYKDFQKALRALRIPFIHIKRVEIGEITMRGLPKPGYSHTLFKEEIAYLNFQSVR